MDTGPCCIENGTNVNIKRTDGRVHSALVSGVNYESRTVTVEWFERGETKGKEVEIDVILALNPELMPTPAPRQTPATRNQIIEQNNVFQMPNKLTRDSSASSSEDEGGFLQLEPEDIDELPPPSNHSTLSNDSGTLPLPRGSNTARPNPTRQSIPVANNKGGGPQRIPQHQSRRTNIYNANGHSDPSIRSGTENIPPTYAARQTQQIIQQQQQQQQQQTTIIQQTTTTRNATVANTAITGNNRRSNVVKEVEKLKENREKRRQRQAELKEEKEALMNQDPGNPNWEFSAMIREYQSSIEFRPLRDTDPVEDHQITVCVRKRPLNKKEVSRKEVDVVSVPNKDQLIVHEPKNKVDLTKFLENQHFRFDYAFDESCNNEIVYKYTAKPLVHTIFEGGMATCFAYGQTGSGKTHTMGGDFNGKVQDCKRGIYAMAAKDVFKYLRSSKYRPLNLIVSASFFEIYSGKVFDLLADKAKLRVLEDGKQQVQIVGLTEKIVDSCEDVLKLIQHGNNARTSGQTSANSNSSRSHAVFQILVRSPGLNKVHGKFSLIDLAGNERGADTSSANRQTRMEGAEINKSLLALKECIRALGKRGAHLPFRASKLTQVLRDSFIGEKSRTCMIAMISPGMSSCEHSLNTLRYADRVKELAATDPTELKAEPMDSEDHDIHMKDTDEQENDLAQLRSLNGNDNNLRQSTLDSIKLKLMQSLNLPHVTNVLKRKIYSSSSPQTTKKLEGDMSQDMYTFHEAVSQIQLVEDEVLDDHKSFIDHVETLQMRSRELFRMTHDVDYDQDGKNASNINNVTQASHIRKRRFNSYNGFNSRNVLNLRNSESNDKSVDKTSFLCSKNSLAKSYESLSDNVFNENSPNVKETICFDEFKRKMNNTRASSCSDIYVMRNKKIPFPRLYPGSTDNVSILGQINLTKKLVTRSATYEKISNYPVKQLPDAYLTLIPTNTVAVKNTITSKLVFSMKRSIKNLSYTILKAVPTTPIVLTSNENSNENMNSVQSSSMDDVTSCSLSSNSASASTESLPSKLRQPRPSLIPRVNFLKSTDRITNTILKTSHKYHNRTKMLISSNTDGILNNTERKIKSGDKSRIIITERRCNSADMISKKNNKKKQSPRKSNNNFNTNNRTHANYKEKLEASIKKLSEPKKRRDMPIKLSEPNLLREIRISTTPSSFNKKSMGDNNLNFIPSKQDVKFASSAPVCRISNRRSSIPLDSSKQKLSFNRRSVCNNRVHKHTSSRDESNKSIESNQSKDNSKSCSNVIRKSSLSLRRPSYNTSSETMPYFNDLLNLQYPKWSTSPLAISINAGSDSSSVSLISSVTCSTPKIILKQNAPIPLIENTEDHLTVWSIFIKLAVILVFPVIYITTFLYLTFFNS